MNPSGVLSAIQLAHATVEYTRDLTLSDVKMGALSWEWFSDWIQANNGLYPELYSRMSRVDTLVVDSRELAYA
jgi:predicted metal-dependent hydrolase